MQRDRNSKRRWRTMAWSLVAILGLAMVLPLSGYVYTGLVDGARAQEQGAQQQGKTNPRANYWRAVRDGAGGSTAASGPYVTNEFIQNGGENWRQFRNGPIATYGAWFLPLVLLAIGLFYLLVGQAKIEGGRSGMTVPRWSVAERTLHWFTAILFVIMAVTGLSLLFGRAALIPVLGPEGFGAWANLSKALHNYLGPFFSVGVLLIIVAWIRDNIPNKSDLEWLKKGGGIVGNEHPPAGRMNAGEKGWFWIICTFGVATVITGFIMDFPVFGQTRETMQITNIVHSICSIIWMAVFFGHVYIGTLGTEGAFEGMTKGEVDVNWAKQHHDQWYEKLQSQGVTPSPASGGQDEAASPYTGGRTT